MKHAYLAVLSLLMSIYSFAQDKKVEIDIDKDGGSSFWGSPIVWVIGAAVFILLLVALLRGGKSSD